MHMDESEWMRTNNPEAQLRTEGQRTEIRREERQRGEGQRTEIQIEEKRGEGQREEIQREERQRGEGQRAEIRREERQKEEEQGGEWPETERQREEREDAQRRRRRQQRIAQMKREKHRREMLLRYGVPCAAVLCILLLAVGIRMAVRLGSGGEDGQKTSMHGVGESDPQAQTAELHGTSEENLSQQDPSQQASADSRRTSEENPSQQGSADSHGTQEENPSQQNPPQQASADSSGDSEGNNPQTEDFAIRGMVQANAAYSIGLMLLEAPKPVFEAHTTESTDGFSDSIISEYGIIIDVESGEVLAHKGGWDRINPASMTKILTILVAAEHMTDLEGTFTMTIDITDYSFRNDCSNVGFDIGEVIPVKDLFYGTVLQSGADAALGLAVYVAGSHEAFVDMMNEKLEEIGLSETTHFTNCVGLYDEEHYTTPYDMAVILKAAADNEFCRQVLSEHHYVTAPTEQHPEGIDISNWFLRRIEDRDTHGEVLCAKTGYVVQSKNCAASLAADHGGREYICVTAGSNSVWTCIKDQVGLYQRYLPE